MPWSLPFLSYLLLVYQLILATFANYCRHFCLRRICSFPANLFFPLDPAVTLPMKVNTSCLVWFACGRGRTVSAKQMGIAAIRGVYGCKLPHLCQSEGRGIYLEENKQHSHSSIPCPSGLAGDKLHKAAEVGAEHCLCKAADGGIT